MSITENALDVERRGHDALEEELRKARIELEKSQAVLEALTSVLVRMNEGRRDEKPKAPPPPKPPMPPKQEPGPPTINLEGSGSLVDDFRRFGKFVARLWRRKPEPPPPPPKPSEPPRSPRPPDNKPPYPAVLKDCG